jgi:hypothetical protein
MVQIVVLISVSKKTTPNTGVIFQVHQNPFSLHVPTAWAITLSSAIVKTVPPVEEFGIYTFHFITATVFHFTNNLFFFAPVHIVVVAHRVDPVIIFPVNLRNLNVAVALAEVEGITVPVVIAIVITIPIPVAVPVVVKIPIPIVVAITVAVGITITIPVGVAFANSAVGTGIRRFANVFIKSSLLFAFVLLFPIGAPFVLCEGGYSEGNRKKDNDRLFHNLEFIVINTILMPVDAFRLQRFC